MSWAVPDPGAIAAFVESLGLGADELSMPSVARVDVASKRLASPPRVRIHRRVREPRSSSSDGELAEGLGGAS